MPSPSSLASSLRRLDRDRYLCALFAPADRREALFALYAFNAEVARIREVVNEPLAGQIRLRWWMDALEAIFAGDPPHHPVARGLSEAVRGFNLSRPPFEALLEARGFDMQDLPPKDLDALVAYAEGTSATLVGLSLEILGAGDRAAAEAGRHVGIAWALTGLLRAVPFHAARGRVYLPATLSRDAGLDLDELLRQRSSPGLCRVVGEVAQVARDHLEAARRQRGVSRRARPALLPATLADLYLAMLERVGFDPFRLPPHRAGAAPIVRLCAARLTARF